MKNIMDVLTGVPPDEEMPCIKCGEKIFRPKNTPRDTVVCFKCKAPTDISEPAAAQQTEGMAIQNREPSNASGRVLLPNQSGRIVFYGLLAWLIGIFGLMALGQGMQNLERIKKGEMTKDGEGAIVFGMVSGVLGFIVNFGLILQQCASGQFFK